MNNILKDQFVTALKGVALGKWARTSAVVNALQSRKLRLSKDSVARYLKQLQGSGIVQHKFEDNHNHWMLI